jgi:hypothetical protein
MKSIRIIAFSVCCTPVVYNFCAVRSGRTDIDGTQSFSRVNPIHKSREPLIQS